nr:MAG TPA: hypothetical protein [Caudoviricetes sp.]
MFWFNGWTVYLMKGVSNMAIKKYIGARYVPKFMGAWDKASEYAALSVVYTNDQSYVSRKTVPANTEITNTEFWIKSADWNAQVEQYNQHVEQYNQNVERYNQNVETYSANVDNFFDATIHAYNTKEEMVNDTTIQLEYTLITCGANAVGDGGGSLYKVASSTSATAVALKNGLFAVPFKFTIESPFIASAPAIIAVASGSSINYRINVSTSEGIYAVEDKLINLTATGTNTLTFVHSGNDSEVHGSFSLHNNSGGTIIVIYSNYKITIENEMGVTVRYISTHIGSTTAVMLSIA